MQTMTSPLDKPIIKGRWKKGQSGNPEGRVKGTQFFIDRAKYILEKHKVRDVKAIIDNPEVFDDMPSYDGMILRRIAEAYADGGGQSMVMLLDRLLGKPKQEIEQTTEINVNVVIDDKRQAARLEIEGLYNVVDHVKTQPVSDNLLLAPVDKASSD